MDCERLNNTAVALGSFDGLHTGHKKVIASALSMRASGLLPVILLFDEHPQAVLGKAPDEILQKHIRDRILSEYGIKAVTVPFREIYKMTPEEFFNGILIKELGAKALCCGENYRFGKDGAGDSGVLSALCKEAGVKLDVSESVNYYGSPVSSTRIRKAIKQGRITLAGKMLGRPFCYDGTVEGGDRRGRLMGAPTANQYFPADFIVPAFGAYASSVTAGGREYCGVTNIGVRPTFGKTALLSETHIIDFEGDLYGENIEVRLLEFMRAEKKFGGMDELARQIKEDISASRLIYEKRRGNGFGRQI